MHPTVQSYFRSFKNKFASAFTIIITAALMLLIIGAIIFYYTRNLMEDELQSKAENELTIKNILIRNTLQQKEVLLKANLWDVNRKLQHPDSLYSFTRKLLYTTPGITGGALAFMPDYYPEKGKLYEPYSRKKGNTIETYDLSGPDHDYTQMEFFQRAVRTRDVTWSDPYYDLENDSIYISTLTMPVYNKQDSLAAILAADISLEWLGDTLNIQHIYPSSFDLILTEDGKLISGPPSNHVKQKDVLDIVRIMNDSTYTRKPTNSGRRTMIEFYDEEDKEKAYIFYTKIKTNPYWQIAVVYYDSEIYSQLYNMRRNMILMMLAAIAALGLIVYLFAKSDRKLQKTIIAKERTESELRIANRIQSEMLPNEEQFVLGRKDVDVKGSIEPAKEVGGDLFDYYIHDEKLFFSIGDASGKGIPSALIMAVVHSLFRSNSGHEINPAQIMKFVNESSCQNNRSNMFVTMFIGVLDIPTGKLRYCNAGHEIPAIINEQVQLLPAKANLPVGVFSDFQFEKQEIYLKEGDMLFLYTDGLTEAKNKNNKLFGRKHLIDVLEKYVHKDMSSADLIKKMNVEVKNFAKGVEQSDDLTMLVIKYTPHKDQILYHHELTLNNSFNELAQMGDFIKQISSELSIDEKTTKKIRLAVEEIVVNIMNYAYPEGTEGKIDIVAEGNDDLLKLVITDSGFAFEPTKIATADTTLSAEDRKIGGLGFFLVRKMMDSVNYEHIDGKNVLTLKKIIHKT